MNIFISYRRADTQDLAGRIADRLLAVPGISGVFLDVTGIAPGSDFVERIATALSRKPVCIVLIGPAWRGSREALRIFDARDTVRLEVAQMLAGGLRILPVLAGGAIMPSPEELPEDIRKFATLSAMPIRHETFERDLAALIDVILSRTPDLLLTRSTGRYPLGSILVRALVSFLLSGIGIILAAALHNAVTGRSLDETLGGPGQVWLLIVGLLACGTFVGTFARRSRPGRSGGEHEFLARRSEMS